MNCRHGCWKLGLKKSLNTSGRHQVKETWVLAPNNNKNFWFCICHSCCKTGKDQRSNNSKTPINFFFFNMELVLGRSGERGRPPSFWFVSVEMERVEMESLLAVCCSLHLSYQWFCSVAEIKWFCFCCKMLSENDRPHLPDSVEIMFHLNRLNVTCIHVTGSLTWNLDWSQ